MLQEMTLFKYREGQLVLDFMGYLIARGVSPRVLAQHMGVAKKVIEFLETKEPWQHSGALLTCYSRWACMGDGCCSHERYACCGHACVLLTCNSLP